MQFSNTSIPDLYVITVDLLKDERGFFARTFCSNEFADLGLESNFVQSNISFNNVKGTLRGMHLQGAPHQEVKLVRCTKGSIYDVAVDYRQESPTYLQWFGVELNEDNRKMFYIPKGFAHGYVTLTDESEVSYLVSEFYTPGCEQGLRWNDPSIGIDWPVSDEQSLCVSDKDKAWPLLGGR